MSAIHPGYSRYSTRFQQNTPDTLTPPPYPPPIRVHAHDSTTKTASGLSSGIRGDSEDEARLEEGRSSIRPAMKGGKSDGNGSVGSSTGRGNGSVDPSNPSVSTSVATNSVDATATTSTSSTAIDNHENSRRAGAHGEDKENGGGGGGGGRGRGGNGETMEEWNFERLGRTPLLAAAFEDFSRRALCHESVLFLSEVSR